MSRPVIGLLVRPGTPPALVNLLARLQRWADVRSASAGPLPSAFVATSPRAAGLDRAIGTGRPLALWVGPDEVAAARPFPTALLLTDDPAAARELPDAVVVPADDDGTDLVARSPFVRERWRRRAGFPEEWTVRVGPGGDLPADDPLVPTALALASVAVVTDPGAARAGLASGCPMVVDPATADALGLVDGVHALVGDAPPDPHGPLVRSLLDDRSLASVLSRRGRDLFDARHDPTAAVQRVAAHLGLVDDDTFRPVARLDATLDEMHTPDHSRIRHRVHELLGDLPATVGSRT